MRSGWTCPSGDALLEHSEMGRATQEPPRGSRADIMPARRPHPWRLPGGGASRPASSFLLILNQRILSLAVGVRRQWRRPALLHTWNALTM